MISKLPRWIWTGAWVLAAIAGMVNVVGFLGFEHQTVSHLTGATSMLAAATAAADRWAVLHLSAVVLAFVAGAFVSGCIIQDSTLKLGSRYGVALFIESVLLALSALALMYGKASGAYLASAACGLQNAMVSTYSGTVIRTTHVSGMFTDLGIYLGHAFRGLPIDSKRLKLCLLIISGFFVGGVAGAWSFTLWGYASLGIPAVVTGITAIAYTVYRIRHQDIDPAAE